VVAQRFALPLQALAPMALDHTGEALVMLLNPTGGVLGGDVLDTRVDLGAGARACLTTPSATRVYRSAGAPAVQRFTARVGSGAVLQYVPDHLIPSAGAKLIQRTELYVDEGAVAFVVDAWAAGRVARGEAWRFDLLDTAIAAHDARGPLLLDRACLTGAAERWSGLGSTEGRAYVATVLALAPDRSGGSRLEAALGEALQVSGALGGVSPLSRSGVLARVLAASAPELRGAIDRLWGAWRATVLGVPPLSLRKI
jgi:urease accessory protein